MAREPDTERLVDAVEDAQDALLDAVDVADDEGAGLLARLMETHAHAIHMAQTEFDDDAEPSTIHDYLEQRQDGDD